MELTSEFEIAHLDLVDACIAFDFEHGVKTYFIASLINSLDKRG